MRIIMNLKKIINGIFKPNKKAIPSTENTIITKLKVPSIEELESKMKEIENESNSVNNTNNTITENKIEPSVVNSQKENDYLEYLEYYNKYRYERPYDKYKEEVLDDIILEDPITDLYINSSFRDETHSNIINTILTLFRYKEQINVLDVGCGTGKLVEGLDFLTDKSIIHYTGIDYNPNIIELVQRNIKNSNVYTNYINVSIDKFLDLFEEKYDIIIFSNTFIFNILESEVLFENNKDITFSETPKEYISKILSNSFNLLNENGVLYISFLDSGRGKFVFTPTLEDIIDMTKGLQSNTMTYNINNILNIKYFAAVKN